MKRISPATVTFGVMAIVLGLVAAYIVRQSMEKPQIVRREAPAPPPVVQEVPLIIAANNLPAHTRLAPEDMRVQLVPKDSPAAARQGVKHIPYAAGRILNAPLKAGQIIREEHLLDVGEGLPGLSERLPPGHRAVTIAVEGAETGGKRLTEGDLVDISLTVEGTHPDLGEVSTRTLLRGVLVVDANNGRPIVRTGNPTVRGSHDDNLTVAVKPSDANKLIVAQRSGTLSVALVSAADAAAADESEAGSITRRELLGLKEVVPPVPPRKYTIEKWSGGSVSIIEMTDDRIRESRTAPLPGNPLQVQPEVKQSQETQPTSIDGRTSFVPSGVVVPGVVAQAQ